jgi:amino acid adenylation domain-containing protein
MSHIKEVIEQIKCANISLWLDGDKLKFRAEKGAMTADLKSAIGEVKQQLIEHLKSHNGSTIQAEKQQTIYRHETKEPAPLSFSQQRLWIIDQLEDNSASYNIPFALSLKGHLNISALQRSLNTLVNRHAALRTRIIVQNESPKQKICPTLELSIEAETIEEEQLQTIAEAELHTCFDLEKDALVRIRLLSISPKYHVLLITLHHIISDGWSMGVLIKELATLYIADNNNTPLELPELPIQFTDYAWWQMKQQDKGVFDEKTQYWLEKLNGAPALHDFPTDYPRPPVQSFKGASVKVNISKAQMEELQKFSRAQGVTLFMTLLAALKTLFWKYSGQKDQVIGAPVANRQYPELEGIVGFFANTLVLRSQLDPEVSFEHYLQHIRKVCLSAYANQDVPFERIVELLQPARSLANNPIFQFMLVLQNQPKDNFQTEHLSFGEVPQEGKISRFDMTFMLSETSKGIVGEIEYDTALFDQATIARFLARWKIMLEAICQQPDCLIKQLQSDQTMPDSDRVYAGKSQPLPSHELIQDTFYKRVSEHPEAPALHYLNKQYSYSQLDQKSNQYAQALIDYGVNPDSMVALHLQKCPELVFLTLATWKIGACFVPLDQKHPEQRLQQMIDSAQAKILITDQSESKLVHLNRILLNDFSETAKNSAVHRPVNQASVEQAAYAMYTSGTTGKPQGLLVPHRTITHLMSWEAQQIPGPNKVLQFASIGFDLSILELLLALNSGGSLVIVDDELRTDTQAMCQLINKQQINVAVVPPTVLHHWAKLDSDEKRHYQCIQHIITAGEQLELTSEIRAFFDRYPDCKLHNQYGPAETHVVTAHTFQAPSQKWPKRAPIGKPIDNVCLHILDTMGQPQDKQTPGELYICGPAVGLGYLGQNKIQQNRFTQLDGMPCYRTGDKVRINEDGCIEFLGRLDRQVKIRGFRIELDEIERQLNDLKEVTRSVVSIDKSSKELPRLLAWIVTSGKDISADTIRFKLAEKLPSYMIPAIIILINNVPLNQNGKPDIKQLLKLVEKPVVNKPPVTPSNHIEAELLEIWKSVIPGRSIGITDDFFAIGGHSLLATQLISRVNAELGAGLILKQVFKHPTIQSLAKEIKIGAIDSSPRPNARSKSMDKNLPLSFAQQRLWMLQQFDGIGGTYNMPDSLVLEGKIDCTALNKSFNLIIRRHEILRTRFTNLDGIPVQRIDESIDFKLTPENVTESQIALIFNDEAAKPFDLQQDELMRVRLLKLSENKHVLLVVMHHIISDGWSTGVFVNELNHFYSAFIEDITPVLAPLPVQYADYALWQRNWLKGHELDRQLAFWKNTLSGLPPLLELPTDRPRPIVQSFNGSSIPVEISIDVLKQIQAFCQEQGVTTYMFLLASMQLMLWRYSGQSDIAIGSPVANRSRPEFEKMLGCFVNTIVLRSKITPEDKFLQHLQDVKESTLNAYSHQDIPFEQVVETLNVQRNTSHSPLFQVMLVLQNTPKKALKLGDVQIASLPFESSVSRFDMTFNFNESKQGLSGNIEFNTDLFDVQTVQRMFDYLHELLKEILSKPNSNLENISSVTHASEQQILQELKGKATEYRQLTSVPEEIEKIAVLRPNDIALRWHDESISYQELVNRANNAAQVLINNGVGPGDIVGIHLHPSAQRIVIMLAVAKLAAAYLPLDPAYPQKRLQFMIEDSGLKLLISDTHEDIDLTTQTLSSLDFKNLTNSTHKPCIKPKSNDPFYLIYTSGSTGDPKPVVTTHQNVMRLADNTSYGGLSPNSITLNHSSFSFDASVFEIWGTLVHGGELIIVDKQHKDPTSLCDVIVKNKVNSALFSPLLLNEILITQAQQLKDLKHIVVGGDVFTPSIAQLALKSLPDTTFYNAYGPTENSVISTCHRLSRKHDYSDTIPIGNSIDNSYALILDERMKLLPNGAIGELWLGGDGLALGYAHRTDLTKARFIETERWGRIYKTGDLVKLNHQSSIIYIGRNDHQVKLRGFRIELGEIESVLSNLEGVQNIAVILKGKREHARLAAYISPSHVDLNALRQHALLHLVDFMRPSDFTTLDELPMLPNGKIDRHKLNLIESDIIAVVERTSNPKEKIILEIWQSILERQEIRITDNFFDVGGNSLLLMRLRQKLSQTLQQDIPVTVLFQYTSIQAQADYLTADNQNQSTNTVNKVSSRLIKQNRNANRHRRQKLKRR